MILNRFDHLKEPLEVTSRVFIKTNIYFYEVRVNKSLFSIINRLSEQIRGFPMAPGNTGI